MKKLKYAFFSVIIVFLLLFVYILTYNFVEPKIYDFMTGSVLTKKINLSYNGNKLFEDSKKCIYGSNEVVLVVIDDTTAERYRWPWKRELFCKIFNYFHDYAHPKVVVHDAIFSTPDNDNPESDKKFFDSLKKYDKDLVEGLVFSGESWQDKNFGEIYDKKLSENFALKNIDVRNKKEHKFFRSTIPFPDEYFNSIKQVGSVTIFPGFIDDSVIRDEIIRTTDFVTSYKGKFYPSIALQAFLAYYDYPKIVLYDNYIEFPELNYKIRLYDSKWRQYSPLKFYNRKIDSQYTHNSVSAVHIMDSYDALEKGEKPLYEPELFKDKIVVIGANVSVSEGLLDVKNSSLMTNHPGVDIQATAIDNILHNEFLTVLPKWVNILITLLGMFLVYCAIRTNETSKAILLVILAIFVYLLICTVCFYNSIVINVATPVVMYVMTMILAYIHRYIIENRDKKKVENALGKYMSEDVMKNVVKNIDNLGLGGKKTVVTVLFSDIRGFTSISEKMSAEEVTNILNEYFSQMEPIVRKYNGIINKYIGDAIMAIFGEPIQDENHPFNAVKCACEMLQKVNELQKKWEKEGKPKIEIGIGINTGEAFVGNIGSENRMEYTVIGDTVNLASRLESYNKTYKTKILISQSTYDFAKDSINATEISDVEIRGKADLINIYAVTSIVVK